VNSSPPAGDVRQPVLFVGAGPGDPELITVRGARSLAEADIVVFAGSLVHRALLGHCREDAEIHDSAGLDLPVIIDILARGFPSHQSAPPVLWIPFAWVVCFGLAVLVTRALLSNPWTRLTVS